MALYASSLVLASPSQSDFPPRSISVSIPCTVLLFAFHCCGISSTICGLSSPAFLCLCVCVICGDELLPLIFCPSPLLAFLLFLFFTRWGLSDDVLVVERVEELVEVVGPGAPLIAAVSCSSALAPYSCSCNLSIINNRCLPFIPPRAAHIVWAFVAPTTCRWHCIP